MAPLRVLSLGLSRTGTCSAYVLAAAMQKALNELGIPCFHYLDLLEHTQDCDLWDKALDASFLGQGQRFTRADWDRLLYRYEAVCDMPAYCFTRELIDAYPDAKVVLCSRDMDSWYKSFNDNVVASLPPLGNYLAYLDPSWTGRLRWLANKVMKVYFHAETQDEMRRNAKATFSRHYAMVRDVVPRDRLLEYDIDSGWGPLCGFLGVDEPRGPFPRINDTVAARQRGKDILLKVCKRSAKAFVMYAVPVVAALYSWYWFNTA